jgi:hypothetical protein
MERAAERLLVEHLPYELDMLQHALKFILSDRFTDNPSNKVLRNFTIVAFWTHARNLDEFIAGERNKEISGKTAAARDFTVDEAPFSTKIDKKKVNRQVSHLYYDRSEPDKLVVSDMLNVFDSINSAIKEFEGRLTPDAKAKWKPRRPEIFLSDVLPKNMSGTTHVTDVVIGSFGGQIRS